MTRSRHVLGAACAVALLAAAPAAASTLPPTALLDSSGALSFSSLSGLSLTGALRAEYRTPTGPARPYAFKTSFDLGPVTLTPALNLFTPEIVIPVPIFPDITIPGFTVPVAPTIPLAGSIPVFNGSVISPPLPLGAIFTFDYGSLLLGAPLTFGEVVQNQFETGATVVNVSGAAGPFGGTFAYDGVLQPGGDVILADYMLKVTGPGLLGELEGIALGVINDNAERFVGAAFDQFLATDPCVSVFGLSSAGANLCRPFIEGLDPNLFGIEVASLGTITAAYDLHKSITPIPVPAALPLLASGLAAFGLIGARRRKQAA